MSASLWALTKNEQCERFTQVAYHWATMSDSLKSLAEEMSHHEQIAQVAHQKWANEWITRFFDWIAHPLIFGQKTSDSLRKLMREFPALNSTHHDTSKINLTFSEFLIVSPFFWNVKKRKSDFCLFLCWNCDTVLYTHKEQSGNFLSNFPKYLMNLHLGMGWWLPWWIMKEAGLAVPPYLTWSLSL